MLVKQEVSFSSSAMRVSFNMTISSIVLIAWP